MNYHPILLLTLAVPAFSQNVISGLKAGIPLTQYFETGSTGSLNGGADYSSSTRRYTFGATQEWRWASGFGLEIDGLYHRLGYVGVVSIVDSASGSFRNSTLDVTGDSWDFPVMAKYRFPGAIRPYLAGGGVLRYIASAHGTGTETVGSLVSETSTTSPLDTTEPSDLRKHFYHGLTAGAGVELKAGPVRLLPELRYTRWTANISGPGGLLRFAPNQTEFLMGVLF